MRHLKGKAVGNTVVLEEALPEGVAVDVVVHEAGDHEEFVLSQEMRAELDAAAESIRKGKAVDMDDVLARLEQI